MGARELPGGTASGVAETSADADDSWPASSTAVTKYR